MALRIPVDDVADLADPAQGVLGGQALVGSGVSIHPGPGRSEGDGVHPDAARGIFDGEQAGDRVQPTLGQGSQSGGRGAPGVVDEALELALRDWAFRRETPWP